MALYNFCYSTGGGGNERRLRRLYDVTYSFIKGNYDNQPPVCEIPSEAYVSANERSSVDISITDNDSFAGDLVANVISCKGGRAQISATKKSLIFIPDDGFTGDAEVILSVTDGQNSASEYTMVLHVGVEPPAVSQDHSEEPGASPGIKLPWWLLIVVLAAGALAIVLALLLPKKKK